MRKILLSVSIILFLASLFTTTKEYRVQISQECGTPTEKLERVNWYWEWWEYKSNESGGFIACVGPSTYVTYHPFDVAGIGILISAGLVLAATKQKLKK